MLNGYEVMECVLADFPQYMFNITMLGEILSSRVRPLTELRLLTNNYINDGIILHIIAMQ